MGVRLQIQGPESLEAGVELQRALNANGVTVDVSSDQAKNLGDASTILAIGGDIAAVAAFAWTWWSARKSKPERLIVIRNDGTAVELTTSSEDRFKKELEAAGPDESHQPSDDPPAEESDA